MIKRTLLTLTLLLQCVLVSGQETSDEDKDRQYVTDQLRLSLYQRADSSSPVVKLLLSGDLLLIEELSGSYARVTTADGSRGWVKRGFLVVKPTSSILLDQERQKNTALVAEIEKFSNSKVIIEQYEQDMDKLVEKIELLETRTRMPPIHRPATAEIEAKQHENAAEEEIYIPPNLPVLLEILKGSWKLILPFILVIILLSFLITKIAVETRIKSKFHGIKIW